MRGDYSGGYRGIRGVGFRFVPEVANGVGNGLGLNVLANAVYDFESTFVDQYLPITGVQPYADIGAGLTTETGVSSNLLAGVSYPSGSGSVFFELSTVSFFDYTRMLIGYRAGF